MEVTSTPQSRSTRTPSPPTLTPTPRVTSALGIKSQDLEGVEITFWHPWSEHQAEIIQFLVDEFNANNPWGIDAAAQSYPGFDGLMAALQDADNTPPTPNLIAAYPYQVLDWANGHDVIVDLQLYVEDPEWGFTPEEISDYYPVFWEQDLIEGQRVGIPAQRSAAVLFYNRTWARELGYPSPPRNSTQFRLQACGSFRANASDAVAENNGTGGWIITSGYAETLAWLRAFDHEVLSPTARGYRFDTNAAENAFTFLRKLYEDGCAWLPEENIIPESAFAARQGLFVAGTIGGIRFQEQAFADASSRDEWQVIPFSGPDGLQAITVYGPSFSVLEASPEEQLAAWLLAKWFSQPENQAHMIQASGYLPVRRSVQEHLDPQNPPLDQWSQAVDLLEYAHPEPNYASWSTVRWAVSDVATQLFRWYFTLEQLPATLELLDDTAVEIHRGRD